MPNPTEAARLAEELLVPLGDRWLHTRGVAARAGQLQDAVPEDDRDLLVSAAWLHDIGYSPRLAKARFHPLDGARFLAAEGYQERLCALVAHHSAATFEATERGLLDDLAVWSDESSAVRDALWMADMTTSPRGEHFSYPDRYAEIMTRHRPDSVVGRAMRAARPSIEAAISRTESTRVRRSSGPNA